MRSITSPGDARSARRPGVWVATRDVPANGGGGRSFPSPRRRARHRESGGLGLRRIGFLAVLAVSALLALVTIYREQATRRAEFSLADRATLLLSDAGAPPVVPASPPPLATSRLLLADALHVAREASRLPPGDQRERLLDRAHGEVREVVTARPRWGEAWVTVAFIASLRSPPQRDVERLALIRSYSDAPVLHQAGYWRVEAALAHWQELPPAIRARLVNEAAWLLRFGEIANRATLFNLARQSPAYRPIFLRWRALAEPGKRE